MRYRIVKKYGVIDLYTAGCPKRRTSGSYGEGRRNGNTRNVEFRGEWLKNGW